MPSQSALKWDWSEFDPAKKRFLDNMNRFPRGSKNPTVNTLTWYRKALKRWWSSRPIIAQSGQWMGERWKGLEPAYVRKSTGQPIPVWGGVRRMRKGVVTVASGVGIRQGRGTTKKEREAGFGKVEKGQTFTGRNVKGKLKRDGSRYSRTDKQLGKVRSSGMLGSGLRGPFEYSANNKNVANVWEADYAQYQHEDRPFAWTPQIQRIVQKVWFHNLSKFVEAIWKGARV